MKKLFIGLIVAMCAVLPWHADAGGVNKIVGLSADATGSPAPLPLTITTLCTVSCAYRASPSLISSTRFWAASGQGVGACITSTDGGAVWSACASQPFASGGNEMYAEAADGSIIAVSHTVGPTTCTFKRSTDNAATWNTQFTELVACSPGNNEGQYLYCLSDGRCEFSTNSTSFYRIYRSSNNGVTWAAGETASSFCSGGSGAQWNGTVGVIAITQPGCGGGNLTGSYTALADTWALSIVWSGTQGDCWGPVVYNGSGMTICNPGGQWKMINPNGSLYKNFTLPGSTNLVDNGGVAISFATNLIYVFAQQASPTKIAVWVSQDDLTTFIEVGTFNGGGAGIRGGHAFYANGCIYVVAGGTLMFGKICR